MARRVDITNTNVPQTVTFSYSVEWYEEEELEWKDRLNASQLQFLHNHLPLDSPEWLLATEELCKDEDWVPSR